MELTQQQIEAYDKDGYLIFPELFNPEEVKKLNDAVPELYGRREACNLREKGSQPVKLISQPPLQRSVCQARAPSTNGGAC